MRHDDLRAFCEHPQPTLAGADSGPLAGLTFAAKDLFDVAGWRCCAGHPAWLESQPPASQTAESVLRLVRAGASLAGKTQLGALAFDSTGINQHYGTPVNPRAPDRVPGGSSSGSAVAVAAGLTDFALGTDSACSVRLPANHCGVYGIRPTFGRVPTDGVIPLSPGIDTVGWFARDGALLRTVGKVLLDSPRSTSSLNRLIVARDAFELASSRSRRVLLAAVQQLANRFERLEDGEVMRDTDEPPLGWFWFHAGRIQVWQVQRQHGGWLGSHEPAYGHGAFDSVHDATEPEARESRRVRDRIRLRLDDLLDEGTVLCVPTASGPAPRLDADAEDRGRQNWASLVLCSIAVHGELPQVSAPVATVDGAPVGLSFIAGRGTDEMLLDLAAMLPSVESAAADLVR